MDRAAVQGLGKAPESAAPAGVCWKQSGGVSGGAVQDSSPALPPVPRRDVREPLSARGARAGVGAGAGCGSHLFPATREHHGGILIRHASEDELADLETRAIGRRGPVRLPRRVADTRSLEAWGDMLAPHFGQGSSLNLTGTYGDEYGYSHGCMVPRNVLKDLERFLRSQGRLCVARCAGVEVHPVTRRKVLHFHALVGGHWTAQEVADAARLWASSGRGHARGKLVVDRAGCIEYAAKHALKQGAADNFDMWIPRSRSSLRAASLPDLRAGLGGSRESVCDGSGTSGGSARSSARLTAGERLEVHRYHVLKSEGLGRL